MSIADDWTIKLTVITNKFIKWRSVIRRLLKKLLSFRKFATHAEISIVLMVIQIMVDLNCCINGLQNENLWNQGHLSLNCIWLSTLAQYMSSWNNVHDCTWRTASVKTINAGCFEWDSAPQSSIRAWRGICTDLMASSVFLSKGRWQRKQHDNIPFYIRPLGHGRLDNMP